MAATVISRATWTDDDGSGTTGTIIGNARLQADVYDKVDALFSGASTFEFGGAVTVDGVLTATGAQLTTPTLTRATLLSYRESWQSGTISAGVVSINASLGNHVWINQVVANITSFTITNYSTSQEMHPIFVYFVADGTARSVTHTINGIAVRFSGGGTAPTMTSTNGHIDRIAYTYFGNSGIWLGDVVGLDY